MNFASSDLIVELFCSQRTSSSSIRAWAAFGSVTRGATAAGPGISSLGAFGSIAGLTRESGDCACAEQAIPNTMAKGNRAAIFLDMGDHPPCSEPAFQPAPLSLHGAMSGHGLGRSVGTIPQTPQGH